MARQGRVSLPTSPFKLECVIGIAGQRQFADERAVLALCSKVSAFKGGSHRKQYSGGDEGWSSSPDVPTQTAKPAMAGCVLRSPAVLRRRGHRVRVSSVRISPGFHSAGLQHRHHSRGGASAGHGCQTGWILQNRCAPTLSAQMPAVHWWWQTPTAVRSRLMSYAATCS